MSENTLAIVFVAIASFVLGLHVGGLLGVVGSLLGVFFACVALGIGWFLIISTKERKTVDSDQTVPPVS